ncbi:hypothetical protein H5410_061465 [Solanum commersonii]|uniref:Putative plant transposon protein domain-containing protein n=1 Tax=Solanum commersonii TaxID=4109 RepID=A0A9J5W7T8_SOLCO|nr:hypothetical protein H5410_061465 [Solanum commersonii]
MVYESFWKKSYYFCRVWKFTKTRGHYIPSWVQEFYLAYVELVPKIKKKSSEFRPVNSVMVRGKDIECHIEHINVVLGLVSSIDFWHYPEVVGCRSSNLKEGYEHRLSVLVWFH